MTHLAYLAILAGTFLAAVWLQLLPGVRVLQQGRRWLLSLLPGLLFLGWDLLAAAEGWWWFSTDHTIGAYLLGLPLEEIAFFVVVPTCSILGYEAVRTTLPKIRRPRDEARP